MDLTGVDSVSSVLTGESIAVDLTGVDSVSSVLTGLLVHVSQLSITRSGPYRGHSQCIRYTYGHSEVGLEFPERHVYLKTCQVDLLSKVSINRSKDLKSPSQTSKTAAGSHRNTCFKRCTEKCLLCTYLYIINADNSVLLHKSVGFCILKSFEVELAKYVSNILVCS